MIGETSCQFIGVISKPVGNKGFLQIKIAENADTDLLFNTNSVFLLLDGLFVPFMLEEVEVLSKSAIMKIAGVNTIDKARQYSDIKVYIQESFSDDDTDSDESNQENILGYEVVDVQSGYIGKIRSVNHIPENPLLEVDYKNRTILIPAHDDFIENIDDTLRVIYVKLPEGFLEIF